MLAAAALIQPLAWEPLCATEVALKSKKKKNLQTILLITFHVPTKDIYMHFNKS